MVCFEREVANCDIGKQLARKEKKKVQDIFELRGRLEGKDQAERINPEREPNGILSLHKIRYEFAKKYSVRKSVLDVACGAGYGSAILAEVAAYVIGADLEEKVVSYARSSYQRDNLSFRVEDAEALSFKDGSFDTVVSFETIEHLNDISQYLREACRVLKPKGILIVSTPKARRTTKRPNNPHHTVEFSEEDFRALLEQYFPAVEMYGQIRVQGDLHYWLQKLDALHVRRFAPIRLRHSIDQALGTAPFEDMQLSDQKIVKGDLRRAHNMIAVCTR